MVTNPPAETTPQNNSCCSKNINLHFKNTVGIIKQWLDSLVDDCNKINEILTCKTTNKSDVENIRSSCTEINANYFKLFKSVISSLKKLQINNHSDNNNTCPILARLEKIKNNVKTFTQRPNKMMMINPFDNLLKRFPDKFLSTNEIPQNNSNHSNIIENHERTGLYKVIDNLRKGPQKIRVSIEELINNIRKNLTPGSCQKLRGSTEGTSDHVDNPYHSPIHQKLPFLNPFETVLKLRKILSSPFNNPISKVFNNLRDLPQQIKEIIDEQISKIRGIFTKNDYKKVAEMTYNDPGSKNSSDSSPETLSTQKPSNGLVKNWLNSPMIRKSTVNNPFSKAFDNLRHIPQKIRQSIDDVISNIRNTLNSRKYIESKAMPTHNNSDLITNSSVSNNISFHNPFVDKLRSPSLLKSSFNNPFSQVFDDFRNLLQQIKETIDEQISNIRNQFTKKNYEKLIKIANNDSRVDNSSDSSLHEILSTPEPSNDLVKNWVGSPIIGKSIANNPFSQAFDNLRNIPEKIRKSIDELISGIRNILILERFKVLENKIKYTPADSVTDSPDVTVPETTPSPKVGDVLTVTTKSLIRKILPQCPLRGLFNKVIDSSMTSKDPPTSSTNPLIKVFDHLRNLPEEMRKSIGEQISHFQNLFTKNNHQEPKTPSNSDTAHPNADNNPTNFFNMLFKDMRKTSMPVKVLPHDSSQLFGKTIDEISTNIRKFFVPEEPKPEPDIFDPSHIYKILSSSPFVFNELFKNLFKSFSDIESSGHDHFSKAHDLLHNLGEDAIKSIGGLKNMLKSNIQKEYKKQPSATKILIQQPYYKLFKKQLYHKPLPTYKILPSSLSFYKNKLFSRTGSHSSKYNFLKKFL
ncbi:uncharacterized protein LOC141534961 [Cotesia typhae]|uniref:uncharacterized protein LOC141534961 n=1 Tax=Cotesia typhae TaxID=2053667 RepID=UPI003D691EB7